MATGWIFSCLVHGGLTLAVIFFVQRIHLAPQGEPFQWNVAMVAALLPSTPTPAPAAPATSRAKSLPPPVRPPEPKKPTSIASARSTPPTELAPTSHQVESLLKESHAPQAIAAISAHPAPQLMPLPEHASAPHADISPSSASPAEMNPPSAPLPTINTPEASASSSRSTKVDYGWLAALMAQWIEGLDKRYPVTLRADGIEGKVTLVALLHEDGSLSDVHIASSSGNAVLDQVALEDVRNGPPVKLAHPLERSRISVRFSINYDLKTTR